MSESQNTGRDKKASITVYLQEELGDARLRCDQLLKYLDKAVKLVEQSSHKDHLFEVAGGLIQSIPETAFKLHKALQAVALAADRLDYEEIKQDLRPEKVDELERVLKEVRIRPVQRRSAPMNPAANTNLDPSVAVNTLRRLAATVRKSAKLPVSELVTFIDLLEKRASVTESVDDVAERFELIAHAIENPPENVPGPSRLRLASMLRDILGKNIAKLPSESETSARVALRFQERSSKDLSIAEMKKLQKALEDILVEARKGDLDAIKDVAAKALKTVKLASTEVARFEEGKPADPTQHMDPEDAKAWKEHNEKYRDKFKEASSEEQWVLANEILKQGERHEAFQHITTEWKKVIKALTEGHTKSQNVQRAGGGRTTDPDIVLKEIVPVMVDYVEEVEAVIDQLKKMLKGSGNWKAANELKDRYKLEIDTAILSLREAKKHPKNPKGDFFSALQSIGMAIGQLEEGGQGTASDAVLHAAQKVHSSSLRPSKDFLKKEGSQEDDKEACGDKMTRFEEGKPADPTKHMDPEDAKAWKENTDKYEDKFKSAKDDEDKQSRFEEGKPADPTKHMDPEDAKAWKENTDKYEDKFKSAKDDEDKQSRFEEGKPADPTKHMDPEDAKAWKENTDKYEDKFKAAAQPWEKEELKEMEDLLKRNGYDSKDAKVLQKDGMGAFELKEYLRHRDGGVGSLEYAYGLKKKARQVVAVSSMAVGKWYRQQFQTAGDLYFKAAEQLKNKGWKGKLVRFSDSGRPQKATQISVHPSDFRLWTEVPEADVPANVKAKL